MNGSSATVTPPAIHKLSSLKPVRDLTLGGRGGAAGANAASKKVFMPNLNVVRNKNTNVKTSKDTTARGGRGGRGARSGRGSGSGTRGGRGGAAGNTNASLIQTTGVFSEGAGAINIRKASSGGSSFGGGRSTDDAPSQMRKPTIIKSENLKKNDIKADDEYVRELLGDTEEDDFGDDKTDLEQKPVKLNEAKWKPIKVELNLEKLDAKIKDEAPENLENAESTINIAQKIQKMSVKQQLLTNRALMRYPASVCELLDLTPSQLLLLQLPDALPCEEDFEEVADKQTHYIKNSVDDLPSTSKSSPTPKAPPKRLSLKEMEEGKIGKLLRYKSGKVKLVFGDTYFDLNMGMETGFLQDLMSINTNREERSGNMINLGPIQAKLTATPDWEHLMEQEERRQRQKPA
ncbi:DNA-directed RNA polymerase III subunit RPC4 isoform X1 [Eurosta solidaginis]|uniref:DNA-directed RNA polymerase III subunit RPC4 isoform X1 n=1 Tax=Eurosta solidaginis TaxID=178769 RepID=UPI003531302B